VLKEFKEFALKGNIVEVGVGLIMALALVNLINSLVEHVLMPIIGIIFGKPSFDDALILTINDSQIRFGSFLTVAVSFLFVALAVFFFIVKPYRAFKARQATGEEAPEEPAEDIVLLTQIRDALNR
jgi:large conductance mechanosensitive channel